MFCLCKLLCLKLSHLFRHYEFIILWSHSKIELQKIDSLLTNQKLFIIFALEFKLALIVHRYSSPLEDMKRRFVFQSQIWQGGAEFSLMVTCVWCLWLSIASIILPRQKSSVYDVCDYQLLVYFCQDRYFKPLIVRWPFAFNVWSLFSILQSLYRYAQLGNVCDFNLLPLYTCWEFHFPPTFF